MRIRPGDKILDRETNVKDKYFIYEATGYPELYDNGNSIVVVCLYNTLSGNRYEERIVFGFTETNIKIVKKDPQ